MVKLTLVALSAILAVTLAQSRFRPVQSVSVVRDNVGRYNPDNSGRYSDTAGRYRPDNSGRYSGSDGRYVHDESGRYNGNDGRYVHDDTGKYEHTDPGYKGGNDKYQHQGDKYQHQGDKFGAGAGFGSGSGSSSSGVKRPVSSGVGSSSGAGSGISAAAGFGAPVGLKQGSAAGKYDNRNYRILRQEGDVAEDGYHYLYETENGIYGEEQGKLANRDTDEEAMRASGYFTYTGPDSVEYTVKYTADENGFVPQGDHLPTPPPIPEAILRALEWQRQQGTLYETENGIYGEEQGKLANRDTDEEAMRASGYFTYTGPDSVEYTVKYTADENGFVPQGDHLPTPPPIPEAILRALEWQRQQGTL